MLLLLAAMVPSTIAIGAQELSRVERGHTAMWYDPARSGEGWTVEVLSESSVAITWFTFDEFGSQRWLFGVGQILSDASGEFVEIDELLESSGGRFGPSFDPSQVQYTVVGEATLRFVDCDRGTFSFSAYGQSQSIDIVRLSRTMAAGCGPIHGVPGKPIAEHAAQSGNWYDLSHSGEGFQLHWSEDNSLLLTWYSYDANGNQAWMIGVGNLEGSTVVFPTLYTASGARFGEAFQAEDVVLRSWGSLTLALTCSEGTADYTSTAPGFGSGTQELVRLTIPVPVACPWSAPALGDLYQFELQEIKSSLASTPPVQVGIKSLADNGSLAGIVAQGDGFRLVRLLPDTTDWQIVADAMVHVSPAIISSDGMSILGNEPIPASIEEPTRPLLWKEGQGVAALEGLLFDGSVVNEASGDLSQVVGVGRPSGDSRLYPWIWNESDGQVELPLTDDVRLAYPRAVSQDGNVIVGFSPAPGPDGLPISRAVRWTAGAPPELLSDNEGWVLGPALTCSDDCAVVFGSGQANAEDDHPNIREPWLWRGPGRTTYLGRLPDQAEMGAPPVGPIAAAADGSILVGYAATVKETQIVEDGFIWTQSTGLVSIRSLVSELGMAPQDWGQIRGSDISTNGERILLTGETRGEDGGVIVHAAVLRLVPR